MKVADSAEDGFDPSGFGCPAINDSDVVALKAETDTIDTFDFEDGLFSGSTKKLTTHYLFSDTQFSEFGTLSRPARWCPVTAVRSQ